MRFLENIKDTLNDIDEHGNILKSGGCCLATALVFIAGMELIDLTNNNPFIKYQYSFDTMGCVGSKQIDEQIERSNMNPTATTFYTAKGSPYSRYIGNIAEIVIEPEEISTSGPINTWNKGEHIPALFYLKILPDTNNEIKLPDPNLEKFTKEQIDVCWAEKIEHGSSKKYLFTR